MKKLFLLLAVGTAAGSAAAQVPAQVLVPASANATAPRPDQQALQAARRTQYLAKELSLTPDQQARLQPLLLAQRQQMQVLREQRTTGGRRQGTAQDLRAAQAKFDEQLKTVLTPEQYTKFDLLRDEQHDKLRERRPAGPAQPQAD